MVADGLAHRFAGTGWLFRGLTFSLAPGQVTAVTGPSGCGKSTLLSILAGWERPVEGRVTTQGVKKIAWVFQNPHGVARRSAVDHVAFPYLTRGRSRAQADRLARAVLDRFDLGQVADRDFGALSGGEAQRLMLARAVASAPDMLLVDEPTAQLDRTMALSVTATLSGLAQIDSADDAMIVVIATHDADVTAQAGQVIPLAQPRGGSPPEDKDGYL